MSLYNQYVNTEHIKIIGVGAESKVFEFDLVWKEKPDDKVIELLPKLYDFDYLKPRDIIFKDKKEYYGYKKAQVSDDSLSVRVKGVWQEILKLHSMGVVHCDINKRNIVGSHLIDNGTISLVDEKYSHTIMNKVLAGFLMGGVDKNADMIGFGSYLLSEGISVDLDKLCESTYKDNLAYLETTIEKCVIFDGFKKKKMTRIVGFLMLLGGLLTTYLFVMAVVILANLDDMFYDSGCTGSISKFYRMKDKCEEYDFIPLIFSEVILALISSISLGIGIILLL